ncbi:M28 family peptidase [Hymenobacter negativus]|uniref:M28 family peptidase n=1 Tax=Hymenobacter negativus TaxID=2795026 RepID=A0ABS3QD21_9BACT|nr:M28 family peptidase [Hymenobacter negativus]MBO2009146.1 M28 family peptidase [Hymenobacter negativus]
MSRLLHLTFALLLAAGTLAAQPTTSTPTGKVKTKTKPGRTATAPAPVAPPTDWSVTYANSITPEGLKADLSILASDAYEGRETGKKGQKMAADYIAKAFAADGLAGPVTGSDNPYLQHFDMNRAALDAAASTQVVGGKTYRGNQDFYAFSTDDTFGQPTALQPVFIGYSIKEDAYSDFSGTPDYSGKDVILLLSEPLNAQGKPLLGTDGKPSAYASTDIKGLQAREKAVFSLQARSVIMVLPTAEAFAKVPANYKELIDQERLSFVGGKPRRGLNVMLVSLELGAKLLGTTPAGLSQYHKAVAKTGKAIASPFKPASTTVQLVQKAETFTTENVLGYLEGSDKKDEVLVVSAHYDHLGIKDGVVFNGADDDGSGTVSVLAMARAFAQAKKDGHGPRRSILFLANTGEEEGLLGSKYYTNHPVFPLEKTVTDLNIDMVGRVDSAHIGKGDYVYLVGDDRLSDELHTVSEAANQQYNPMALDYKLNDPNDPERTYYRSDHYNFAKHNIPVIFYTSGEHPDYHKATDDVDKIDFPAMTRRDQLIFHTAWALAARDTRVALKPEFLPSSFTPTPTDLDRYAGTYASAQFPLKITLTREGTALKCQATGQPAFAMEAVSKDVFKFDPAGLRVEFDATQPAFKLKQGGGAYDFKKE